MAEIHFADRDSMKTGLRSPEMAAVTADANAHAAGLMTILLGEETR
jgi:hypothetical protein